MDKTTQRQFDETIDHPVSVDFHDEMIWITLADGRILSSPLSRHPWLAKATPDQRSNYELGYVSIYWPDLDEGLDIEWLLRQAGVIGD